MDQTFELFNAIPYTISKLESKLIEEANTDSEGGVLLYHIYYPDSSKHFGLDRIMAADVLCIRGIFYKIEDETATRLNDNKEREVIRVAGFYLLREYGLSCVWNFARYE